MTRPVNRLGWRTNAPPPLVSALNWARAMPPTYPLRARISWRLAAPATRWAAPTPAVCTP
ncbi:hypothetical protein GCM10011576_59200 [Micromonospora parathelypteridis]|nr:hypothetical protein GCM10011576_59200 [Micromonospora parathelypteridis]